MTARDETREIPIEDPEDERPSSQEAERGELSEEPSVATEDL